MAEPTCGPASTPTVRASTRRRRRTVNRPSRVNMTASSNVSWTAGHRPAGPPSQTSARGPFAGGPRSVRARTGGRAGAYQGPVPALVTWPYARPMATARPGDGESLRSWGSTFAVGLVFPVAALVAAVLVLATAPLSAGLVAALVATLVPWALVAGEVRVGPWPMVVVGVGMPVAIVGAYEAHGAPFLALLAMGWLA